uniref:Delta-like protein n=1 Tax=Panagrolaimus sp. ES5 TaxID=591445 RepID=A0AC34GUW1_9BILA
MNVTVPGQPNFIVFFKQKTLNLKRDKERRFSERNLSNAKVEIGLNLTCDENYFGDDCTLLCEPPKNGSHYTCTDSGPKCHSGWSGAECDIPICEKGCGINGNCVAPNQCSCYSGWLGPQCDQCQTHEGCVNGFCTTKPGTCTCKSNWGGKNCDKIVDKCLENPCMNGGSCFSEALLDHYKCACLDGFTGKRCETAVMTKIVTEHTEIRISENTGFWIFAIVTVIVVGIIIAWFITKRNTNSKKSSTSSPSPSTDGYQACRRSSDIEMDIIKDEECTRIRRHGKNDQHINPPQYNIVNELSAERLSVAVPEPPPTYDEAIGKSSTSSSSSVPFHHHNSSNPSSTTSSSMPSSSRTISIEIPPDDDVGNNSQQKFECKIINEIDNIERRPPKN